MKVDTTTSRLPRAKHMCLAPSIMFISNLSWFANRMLSSIFSSYALLLLCFSHHLFCSATARDTLTSHDDPIRNDRSEGLVSAGGRFELGFFTPPSTGAGRSGNGRYVGIWYHQLNPRTVVWVSNRDKPVPANSTGVFAIKEGNLHVLDATTKEYYWSAKIGASSSALNPMVKLMDSGNLVLSDGNDRLAVNNILWQSFNSPTDTFIPGMIMDKNLELTSWRGEDDPGIGNFTFKLDNQNQYMITKLKSIIYWKSQEPVIGTSVISDEMPPAVAYLLLNFSQSYLKKKSSSSVFTSTSRNSSYKHIAILPRTEYNYTRLVIDFTGTIQFWRWLENKWTRIWSEPKDQCSVFNACGNFGSCNKNNGPSVCKCLPGFKPQSLDKWNSGDFSGGCTRESPLCLKEETFFTLKMMKVGNPDIQNDASNETECKNTCLPNCGCTAYSYAEAGKTKRRDVSTSMCWIWNSQNLDSLQEEYADGRDLSVRVALADLESTVRDCEPCGTTMIPYPLSIQPGCGDPLYFRFKCNASTGQVSFMGPSGYGTYRVISINPRTKKFLVTVDNCDSRNRGENQELNQLPFRVIKWCRANVGNFSSEDSSSSSPVTEMGWDPPLEPTCNTFADCRGWPYSTCNPAKDGKKRCHCNANFRWNGFNLNCTQGGPQVEPFKPPLEEHSRRQIPLSLIVLAVLVIIIFVACIISIYIWRRKMTSERDQISRGQFDSERRLKELIDTSEFKEEESIDVPLFDLQIILDATDNFSDANKLGQGGYGPVYKGKFLGGREIAVKRLSRVSGQGLQEFKNEVVLIAKLQHRNLVRLKGYCMKGEEKILLYEYMPNKSLDFFIFDRTQKMFLNWEMRFNIILGITRGLLYLHQDSRLRIIHRDLKTSNILLDEEMNPKISDFGLARIVGSKEIESNTNTVVGTYGYMSPEYALDGTFSVKSDVFSFGVVVLEIISGKKNTGFYQSKETFSLINQAWRLWKENKVLDLMDNNLDESCNKSQFIKCVNVGLL
ncbi:G-type lectin S-receptor-like serine/threonine-protein kinase At4g03230 [Prunus avium]|uniref:non-specific serine/threonine protein kinase n=1 Tax=Prunus avium TaxID=42229 RepID=A0A6P5TS62_PRUAV|nr:G-type lectin S-receptor-like serine/threonine-protein kinase At4g03230 [Prunus avium]